MRIPLLTRVEFAFFSNTCIHSDLFPGHIFRKHIFLGHLEPTVTGSTLYYLTKEILSNNKSLTTLWTLDSHDVICIAFDGLANQLRMYSIHLLVF